MLTVGNAQGILSRSAGRKFRTISIGASFASLTKIFLLLWRTCAITASTWLVSRRLTTAFGMKMCTLQTSKWMETRAGVAALAREMILDRAVTKEKPTSLRVPPLPFALPTLRVRLYLAPGHLWQ